MLKFGGQCIWNNDMHNVTQWELTRLNHRMTISVMLRITISHQAYGPWELRPMLLSLAFCGVTSNTDNLNKDNLLNFWKGDKTQPTKIPKYSILRCASISRWDVCHRLTDGRTDGPKPNLPDLRNLTDFPGLSELPDLPNQQRQ